MTIPDVNVRLIDFQAPGREMVVPNEDDTYTILINARLSQDAQLKAYQHALGHINNGDFEKSDAQDIESQAHGLGVPEETAPAPIDVYEKSIKHLQRERRKVKKALMEKEKETELIMNLYGPDCFFRAAEHKWLYDGSE